MSKLRIIDVKRMEKLLFLLALSKFARREVTRFPDTLMEGLLSRKFTYGT